MKTAISIPDIQFEAAEKLAAQLGLSRSELYQKALAEFIAKHSDEKITEKLNEIYAEKHIEDIDEELLQLQAKSIPEEDW
jgi:metal-responsive CopG/Arc/MetJ family transcriptional regulator